MSFLLPAYLLGILGLALPWILHRFSDQQAPEHAFPSSEFLESTTPPVSRRKTLRYKVLLALRVAALLLLCLLFAEPWVNRSSPAESSQQHHMIVIDTSLSMRAEGRWPEAMKQANRLLDELAPNQPYDLVAFDQKVSLLASRASETSQAAIPETDVLSELRPGYASADFGAVLQHLNRMAVSREMPVRMSLITDLQSSALPAQLNALYAPNIAQFEILNVVKEQQSNVHLSATASAPDGVNAQVRTSLVWSRTGSDGNSANGGSGKSSTEKLARTVQVSSSGAVVASRQVELSPDEITLINFDNVTVPAQENPNLQVSIMEPDDLLADNSQTVLFDRLDPVDVVLLQNGRAAGGNASVFLTTALETDALATVNAISGAASLVPQDVSQIVAGRNISTSVDIDLLQFVDKGNSALIYNSANSLSSSVVNLTGSDVGAVDDSHPLALSSIDWFGTRFYGLADFQLSDQDRVLIETSDGQVLLAERATQRGRLLLLNDPLDGLASNLPLQPSFVALVQAIVRYFDANTAIATAALVGERVTFPPGVQILNADDEPMLGLGSNRAPSSVELEVPGLYTVVSSRGEQSLKVSLDPAEADLTMMSDSSLETWLNRYSPETISRDSADDNSNEANRGASTTAIESDELRQPLWFWLLPLVVAAFLLETLFANRRLDVRRDGS